MSERDDLFLTLVKLRLDCPYVDLARRFTISQSSVSRKVNTWILLMDAKFRSLLLWPSWEKVDSDMPTLFKVSIIQREQHSDFFRMMLLAVPLLGGK